MSYGKKDVYKVIIQLNLMSFLDLDSSPLRLIEFPFPMAFCDDDTFLSI